MLVKGVQELDLDEIWRPQILKEKELDVPSEVTNECKELSIAAQG